MKSKINEDLNKLDIWKNRRCEYCGRKYPDTLLNIEGHIHHHCDDLRCLDVKDCQKVIKKQKKRA